MSIQHARAAVTQMLGGLGENKSMHIVQASVIPGTELTRVYGLLDKRGGQTMGAAEASAVICRSLGGKVTPVADSFTILASNAVSDLVTGFVAPLKTSRPFDGADTSMRAMAGNMFMDEEEHLWKLQKTEAGDILVRSHIDNADEIRVMMQSLCSGVPAATAQEHEQVIANHAASIGGIPASADILYVDPETQKVMPGVIIAQVEDVANTVAVAGADGSFAISRDLIVCATAFDGLEDAEAKELEAQASSFTIADITEYYRKLFQRREGYFQEFMTRWRSHFSVA